MRKNTFVPNKEVDMNSIADSSVIIQTSSESVPATPSWFGEVALIIPYRRRARRPFCHQCAGALGPPPFRALRGHRFSGRALRLRHQRRTHAGGVLRAALASCATLHGLVRPRETTLPLGALTLSGELDPCCHRSLTHALSRRSARAPSGHRATHRPAGRSRRQRTCGL